MLGAPRTFEMETGVARTTIGLSVSSIPMRHGARNETYVQQNDYICV